jgi:WD40 repeat protein
MFQDYSLEVVEFPSSWKKEKSSADAHTQTSEVLANETETQTSRPSSVAVQTEPEPGRPPVVVVDNSAPLKEFLRRVEPFVLQQLKQNAASSAFDGYWVELEEEAKGTTCVHTLNEASLNSEFPCTGLAWNCTGSVLGASFGRFDHEHWCTHKSLLCMWNMDRKSIDKERAHISIDTPSCVMCLSFHPDQPAVVAGGLFSGEVMVWKCGSEGDPLLASSGLTDSGHREPLSQVCWVGAPQEERQQSPHRLLTLGSDGLLLVWRWVKQSRQLAPVSGYKLTAESVPRNFRAGRARGDTPIGGTALSFPCEDSSLAVVGCENGCILKCSLHPNTDIGPGGIDMRSPVTFAFRPHAGPVYGCDCSPFHRNLLLTASTDSSVRLHSLLDSSPLLAVEPDCGYLFSVQWSPSRPLVFAVGSADGHLLLYDLTVSHVKPSVLLDASPHHRPVYSLQYNSQRPQVLASGDASGVVKVWRLGSHLTSQVAGETEQLASLADSTPHAASL